MSMIGNYRRVTAAELKAILEEPEKLDSFLYSEEDDDDRHLDIDKSWHAIHFLLNHDPWGGEYPYSSVVLGGSVVSDEDVGYGPARYLPPEEAQEAADALSLISPERLLKRFDAKKFNEAEIYPQGWGGLPEEFEYIGDYYGHLVRFFQEAARRDEAILLWIS